MEMTIKERINRFCEKYPEPRQCKIILNWNRKDGQHSQEVGTGKDFILWGTRMFSRTVGKPLYIQHYRYDDETELMECAYAVMDCHTPKPDEVRRWKYAERYFVTNEDVYDEKGYRCVYDINGNIGRYVIHNSYGDNVCADARYFLQCFVKLNTMKGYFNEAFTAMSKGNPTLPPRYISENYYSWVMTEWVRHHRKTPKTGEGKTAQRIDKLAQKELDDEACMRVLREAQARSEHYCYACKIAYFDKENMVFRLFNTWGHDVRGETHRVYIDGNKFFFARKGKEGWHPNGSFTQGTFSAPIANMEDVYGLAHCNYLRNFRKNTVYDIISIMRNPEIEQLCNMGLVELAKSFMPGYNVSIKVHIEDTFGKPDKKKKNICQRYHLTKKQLECLNGENKCAVRCVKNMLGCDNLSSIDPDSFRKYVKCAKSPYYLRSIEEMNPDTRKKMFIKIANINDAHPNAVQLFSDTYYNAIRYGIDINSFRNYDELVRMHDTVTDLRNAEIAEQRRLWAMKEEERNKELEKKMARIDKERAKLNYEDDEYLIRIPTSLSEIVMEGSNLRHCVSSYTNRHARGEITILFLRKKSAPDKSFYTIELTNANTIQQIHGFGNRWIGNDPDAIPTVVRWLRKNNISCSQQILTSTATGYGDNRNYIEMPVVDGRKGV